MSDDAEPSPSEEFLKAAARVPAVEPPAPGREMVGRSLGRYQIVAELGRGGMGVVYRAKDPKLGREVALKVISHEVVGSAVRRERFLREARAACAVVHENVVAIHDVFEDDAGTPVLVMELLNGETLRELLDRETTLDESRAIRIAAAIASAAGAAHAMGIVHRDLKPENVFVTRGGTVKVLDFGVAKLLHGEGDAIVTESGAVIGTLSYMAPEQAFGDPVDHRADVWALGTILYEAVAGRRPIEAASHGKLIQALASPDIAPLESVAPGVSGALSGLCLRMLAADRQARCDMAEVARVLGALGHRAPPFEPAKSGADIDAHAGTEVDARRSSSRTGSRGRSSRLGRPVALGAAAIGVAAVAWIAWPLGGPPAISTAGSSEVASPARPASTSAAPAAPVSSPAPDASAADPDEGARAPAVSTSATAPPRRASAAPRASAAQAAPSVAPGAATNDPAPQPPRRDPLADPI